MATEHQRDDAPVIGLALGSGSARGWAHIGVIQALEALGIRPQVVAGTSVGALVGAVYVAGELDAFGEWVKTLNVRDVVGLMDFTLSGGMVKGEKLFGHIDSHYRNPEIDTLSQRYVSVATEMESGREIWINHGPVFAAARASCALPGVFTPVAHKGRWMLDGGLVNPVPVSACRAHGAEVVIAVNLNAQLVGAHLSRDSQTQAKAVMKQELGAAVEKSQGAGVAPDAEDAGLWQRLTAFFGGHDAPESPPMPGFLDVISASVNIMQDRITRSRMAGDPPELTLIPQLADFAMMDFHRAAEAIEEGRRLVRRNAEEIRARARI